jgi:DNA-binding winged helix-turn-helix (wHTH) protein
VIAFAFGPFELDPQRKELRRDGQPIPLNGRLADVLCALVARRGQMLSKDQLIQAAWRDVAVTDNSLEQAISALRRRLDSTPSRQYIETLARRGYRFVAPVTRVERRTTDPHSKRCSRHTGHGSRGAALESLERSEIGGARAVFADVAAAAPAQASAHIGLANACVMQFEMTRAEPTPDLPVMGVDVKPVISQFGWQYERQFYSSGGDLTPLNVWVFLLGALEQGTAIPGLNWIVGLRTPCR